MNVLQDLHVHTHLSLCAKPTATVAYYIQKAHELGLDTIAFTDHLWDHQVEGMPDLGNNPFYRVQDFPYILQLKDEIAKEDPKGLRILFGAEVEFSPLAHKPAITVEHAKQLDVLLVPNSHTHIIMPKNLYQPMQAHADFMLQAYYDAIRSDIAPYITAMAHPFAAVCCPYDMRLLLPLISDNQYGDCFSEAAGKGIAFEINTSEFAEDDTVAKLEADPYFRILKLAKEAGSKFTFGSDSHSNTDHDQECKFLNAYIIGSRLGLTDADIKRV